MSENNKYQTEIDFKAIITDPTRWMGFVYLFAIIGIVCGGWFYVLNLNNVSKNRNDMKSAKTLMVWKDLDAKPALSLEGVDVKVVGKSTPEMIAKGQELFSKNCVSCHGSNGMGDGVAGASLNPKPRNFHSQDGWKNGSSIEGMFKTLQEGVPGSGMAAFEYLPVDERFALIHYIRSIGGNFPEITDKELDNLENDYVLSAGKQSKAQIPVLKASEIRSKEFSEKTLVKLNTSLSNLKDNNLWLKSTNNGIKALNTLNNNSQWLVNSKEFLQVVISNAPGNGFNTKVALLSSEDLNTLWSSIKNALVSQSISLNN